MARRGVGLFGAEGVPFKGPERAGWQPDRRRSVGLFDEPGIRFLSRGGLSIEIDRRLRDSADLIAETARGLCPVDTGFLQSSIHVTPAGYRIRADAPYAGYVEFGTSKMAAQPFLRPAIEAAMGKVRKIWQGRIRRLWEPTETEEVTSD